MMEFLKNEWQQFLKDMENIKDSFSKIFSPKKDVFALNAASVVEEAEEVDEQEQDLDINLEVNDKQEDLLEEVYENDTIDNKVTAYFGEDISTVRENKVDDTTQHEVLREYAQYFKPYNADHEMCSSAFKGYYDRHSLKIATKDISVDQVRIIQNNVDIFIEGQDIFGENGQFIDSRVDGLFEKIGADQINKLVNILHDKAEDGLNLQGERLLAGAVHHMVDNGIKIKKDQDALSGIKIALEDKLNIVHNSLKSHDDWNEEYQQLLSDERKYLYALNRIEQYETEQRIAEFELTNAFEALDVVVD